MSNVTIQPKQKRRVAYTALFGAVLAVICHFVPPEYRAACNFIASVCSGGPK